MPCSWLLSFLPFLTLAPVGPALPPSRSPLPTSSCCWGLGILSMKPTLVRAQDLVPESRVRAAVQSPREGSQGFFFFFSFDGLHICLGRRWVLERSITGSPVPHTCPPCVPFSWTFPQSVTASPGASTGMLPLYSSPFLFTSKESTAPESTQGPL